MPSDTDASSLDGIGTGRAPLVAPPSVRRPLDIMCPTSNRRSAGLAVALAAAFALGAVAGMMGSLAHSPTSQPPALGGAATAAQTANVTTTPHGWTCPAAAAGGGATCLNGHQGPIERVNFDVGAHKLMVGGRYLGRHVVVVPQKLGGGVTVTDLSTGRSLASLWYSNYGDYGAIPHHIIAFPSENPYDGFEFINSCQGGLNTHLYGLPNVDPNPPASTNIYKLRYDGTTLQIMENVSATTGLGLGVHTTINPRDAESFAVSDGQKDVWALFDRRTTVVKAAFRYDWRGDAGAANLARNWIDGGVLTVTRITPDEATGKFDLLGSKGNKIDVELAPMAEGELEAGRIPGADQAGTVAADGLVFHPGGRWGVEIIRMLGAGVVHDLDAADYRPVTYLSFNGDTPDQADVVEVEPGRVWTIRVDRVGSPGHELGFTPAGDKLMMMNNLRENSVGFFDTRDADPLKWAKLGVLADPLWHGEFPNPFHMAFSHDSRKAYFVVLRPKPERSNLMIVDLENLQIKKEIHGIARDLQSAVTSMDGKYLFIISAGFQKFESALFVLDIETDTPLGFVAAPGGHHDIALVPRTAADMKFTRAVCM